MSATGSRGRDQPRHRRVSEDGRRVSQVSLDGSHGVPGQQRLGMRDDDGVIVHVHHPAGRIGSLGDLMSVLGGRQAGPDVEVLPDALPGQPGHGTSEEQPVFPARSRSWG